MEIDEIRAELEATLRDAVDERPTLLSQYEAAARSAHDASHRWENFCLSVARGLRHGADAMTPAVAALIADERSKRDAAAGAATRAKRELANCEWRIESRRAELDQLERVANPPAPDRGPLVEVVKRPAVVTAGDVETIIFPAKPAA